MDANQLLHKQHTFSSYRELKFTIAIAGESVLFKAERTELIPPTISESRAKSKSKYIYHILFIMNIYKPLFMSFLVCFHE